MLFKTFLVMICLFGTYSCSEKNTIAEQYICASSVLFDSLEYNDLVMDFPSTMTTSLAERPDDFGALGRNKDGYIHVRFQMHMTRITDYGIKFKSEEAISEYKKNLDYSFSYQNTEGDFQFVPPEYLLNGPDYLPPSQGDLASGTAFFAYSLGLSLTSLSQSDWYNDSQSLTNLRNDITALHSKFINMLAYLKESVDLLNTVDDEAPNRLLFNAIAFYTLGTYLNDNEAKDIGIAFAEKALSSRNETEGYFIEAGGWDSSYNGVATKLGFELFTLIPDDSSQALKDNLEKAISCSIDWQKSRILSTGEISTEGNTRVFPGGEEFLGNGKDVDVIKTVKALYYMNSLSGNNEYRALAENVIGFYQ